jgi:hypothetical protein
MSIPAVTCKYCPAGFGFDTFETPCTQCAGGKYQDQDKSIPAVTCKYCPAGFAFATFNTSCTQCSGGKYQDQDKSVPAVTCKYCPAGFGFATFETSCIKCGTGKYAAEGYNIFHGNSTNGKPSVACCGRHQSQQRGDYSKCKSIEITSVKTKRPTGGQQRRYNQENKVNSCETNVNGHCLMFRGTDTIEIEFRTTNWSGAENNKDVYIWIIDGINGTPLLKPTKVQASPGCNQTICTGSAVVSVPPPSSMHSGLSTGPNIRRHIWDEKTCEETEDRAVRVRITDNDDYFWDSAQMKLWSNYSGAFTMNPDSDIEYTHVSGEYEQDLTYLKNDLPKLRHGEESLTVKPHKIYESSPIVVCSAKIEPSSGFRALTSHDAPGQLRGPGRLNVLEYDISDLPMNSSWPIPRDAIRDRDSPDRFIKSYEFRIGIQQKQTFEDKKNFVGLVLQTNNLGEFTETDQKTSWSKDWAQSVAITRDPNPPNPMFDLSRSSLRGPLSTSLFELENDPLDRGATVHCSINQINDGCSSNSPSLSDRASAWGRIAPLSMNGKVSGGSGGGEYIHITGAGFALSDKIAAVTLRHSDIGRCKDGSVLDPYTQFDVFCHDGIVNDYLPNADVGINFIDREFQDKTEKIQAEPGESKHGHFFMYFFSAKNATDKFTACDATSVGKLEECYKKYRDCISDCSSNDGNSFADLFMALKKTITLSRDQAECVNECRTKEDSNGKVLKVDCGDAESYSRLSCMTPRFDFKAKTHTAVVGPTVVYKGCYSMAIVTGSNMVRVGGKRARRRKKRRAGGLAYCQLECQRKEMGYDMFGLEGTDCWCGHMTEFPVDASPDEGYCSDECVRVDTTSDKLGPGTSDVQNVGEYTEIGCYDMVLTTVDIVYDLPYELYTTQSMTIDKCSDACKSYDYFSIVGNSRCFCGYYFHRDKIFDVGEIKKGSQIENRSSVCQNKRCTIEVSESDEDKPEHCDMKCMGNVALGGAQEKCGGAKAQRVFRQRPGWSSVMAVDAHNADIDVSPGARCGYSHHIDEKKSYVSMYEIKEEHIMHADDYTFGESVSGRPENVTVEAIGNGGFTVYWSAPKFHGGYDDFQEYDWRIRFKDENLGEKEYIYTPWLYKQQEVNVFDKHGSTCMPVYGNAVSISPEGDAARCGSKWQPRKVLRENCGYSFDAVSGAKIRSQGNVMTFVENGKRQWCTSIFSADQTMEPGKDYESDDSWAERDVLYESAMRYTVCTGPGQSNCRMIPGPEPNRRILQYKCQCSPNVCSVKECADRLDRVPCSHICSVTNDPSFSMMAYSKCASCRVGSGLAWENTYDVQVMAINPVGRSVWSGKDALPLKVSPKEDIGVPGQIISVDVNDKEPEASQVHISWFVPKSDGGSTITFFIVEFQRLDENREEICGVSAETIRVEAEAERILKNRYCPSITSYDSSCRESEDKFGRYAVARTKFKHRATLSIPWEEGANGLKPATNYRIRIFAGNREGMSIGSEWFGGKGHPVLVRTMDETGPKEILGIESCPDELGASCVDSLNGNLAEALWTNGTCSDKRFDGLEGECRNSSTVTVQTRTVPFPDYVKELCNECLNRPSIIHSDGSNTSWRFCPAEETSGLELASVCGYDKVSGEEFKCGQGSLDMVTSVDACAKIQHHQRNSTNTTSKWGSLGSSLVQNVTHADKFANVTIYKNVTVPAEWLPGSCSSNPAVMKEADCVIPNVKFISNISTGMMWLAPFFYDGSFTPKKCACNGKTKDLGICQWTPVHEQCERYTETPGKGGQVFILAPGLHHIGPREVTVKSPRSELVGSTNHSALRTRIDCGGHRCLVSGYTRNCVTEKNCRLNWFFPVRIKAITFMNGAADRGAFFYIRGFSNTRGLKLEDLVFKNGYADFCGGAIFIEHSHPPGLDYSGSIVISAHFVNTTAGKYGGALAVFSSTGVVINQSTFNDTRADIAGGAVAIMPLSKNAEGGACPSCPMDDFTAGTGDPFAPPVEGVRNRVIIINSEFHSSQSISPGGMGGGLYVVESEIELRNSYFYQCLTDLADGEGGGIYAVSSKLRVSGTSFTSCKSGGGGGGSFVSSELDLSHSTFDNNLGNTQGGGAVLTFFVRAEITMNKFRANVAKRGGAVYLSSKTQGSVHSSVFAGNSATDVGGGVFCSSIQGVQFVGNTFENNKAETGGGALASLNSVELSVHADSIEKNPELGDGVFIFNNDTATVIDIWKVFLLKSTDQEETNLTDIGMAESAMGTWVNASEITFVQCSDFTCGENENENDILTKLKLDSHWSKVSVSCPRINFKDITCTDRLIRIAKERLRAEKDHYNCSEQCLRAGRKAPDWAIQDEANCRKCNFTNGARWCKINSPYNSYSCVKAGENKSSLHVNVSDCKASEDQCAIGSYKYCEVQGDSKDAEICGFGESFTCASGDLPITNKDKCPFAPNLVNISPFAVGDMVMYKNAMMWISEEKHTGYRLSGQDAARWFGRNEFVTGWNNFTGNKVEPLRSTSGGVSKGGGAIFVDTSDKDMRNRDDLRPSIVNTVFWDNHAVNAMGGAILWTASDTTMIQQDLLPLVDFQEKTGFARRNRAASGSLIASTAQQLAIMQGPTSNNNRSRGKEIGTTKTTKTNEACIASEISQCSATTFWMEWESRKNKTWDQNSWEEPSRTDMSKQPFMLNILDFYGNLATTSGPEDKITIRSVTKRSRKLNCLPADGNMYEEKNGTCHFDNLGNEKSAVNGVVTFSEYKIKALPTDFTNSLYKNSREDTGPLALEFLLKLDDRGSHDKWLAQAKTKLRINSCKTGDFLNPLTRKCESVNAAGFFAPNANHNLWLLEQVYNSKELDFDRHKAIERIWLNSRLEDWNASCPVGTFGKKDRHGTGDVYFGNLSISAQLARSTCALCPAGWFSDGLQRGECTTCPSGFFGNFTGMGRCRACPEGKFIRAKGDFICEGSDCKDVFNRLACHSCASGRYREAPLQARRCYGNRMNLYGAGGLQGTRCHVWNAIPSLIAPETYGCGDHNCFFLAESNGAASTNTILRCNSSDPRIIEGTVLQVSGRTASKNITYLITVKDTQRDSKTSMDIHLLRGEGELNEIGGLTRDATDSSSPWGITCVGHSWPVSEEHKDCTSCPAGYWTAGSEGNAACHACPAGKYGPHNQKTHVDKLYYGTCLNCSIHEYNPKDRPENSENLTKGDPSLTSCGQCQPGMWTSRTFDGQIKEQWDSITDNVTKEMCRSHCFDDDKEKCLRYEWKEEIRECKKLVSESFVDKVKENDNGTANCYSCKRGEVLSLDMGCERCKSSARGPFDELSGASGTYSFQAGGPVCRKCPFGAICYNGDSIDAGWGWWMSGGTAAGRENLLQKHFNARRGGLGNISNSSTDFMNKDLCPYLDPKVVAQAGKETNVASLGFGVCGEYKCSFRPDTNGNDNPTLSCFKTPSSTRIVPKTVLQLRLGFNYTYRVTVERTKSETEASVDIELSHHKGTLRELNELFKMQGSSQWSVTCVESFECGALCTDISEDGCECFQASKSSTKTCKSRSPDCTCRRTCKQSTDTPWHSTFFDACGSQRKMIRCKGYREEETCGEIQMQALREGFTLFDGDGIAYKKDCSFSDEETCEWTVLPVQCQSCRSTRLISVVPVPKRGHKNTSDMFKLRQSAQFSLKTFTENVTENLQHVDYFEITYALAGSLTSRYHATIDASVNMSILANLIDPTHEPNGIRRNHAYSHCNVFNGFGGRMCAACLKGYTKSGIAPGCFRCGPDWQTWLKVIGLCFAASFIIVLFIIIVMLGAGSDKKSGAVQKILLNYMQMMGIIGSLSIKWPRLLKEALVASGSITMAGETIFPIDCLLPQGVSEVLVKQILLAILPILSIFLNALWWGGRKWCRERRRKKQGIAELHNMDVPKIIAQRHQERIKGFRSEILSGFAQSRLQAGRKMSMGTSVLAEMGHIHVKEVERLTQTIRSAQQNNSSHTHLSRHGLSMDEQATATLHAREFMEYCHEQHVDLHALWRKYDHNGSGDITTAQFETICRGFGFTWTAPEFNHLLMLFDGANQDGYVDLATLIQFSRNFKERFVLSSVTIGVLLYPTLVISFFKMLACQRDLLDGEHRDDLYLMADLDIVCFRGLHRDYLLSVGLPMGLLYVISMPISMLLLMNHAIKHVDTEHHDSVQYRFGILMAGFSEKHYAWEILVTVRKAVLSLIATFGIVLGPDGQLYFAILAIGFFICVQVANKPYNGSTLNNLELWNLLIVFISLYFGILFLLEKIKNEFAMPVAIGLLCVQASFVLYCIIHLVEDGKIFRKKANTAPAKVIKKNRRPTRVAPADRLKKDCDLIGVQMTAKNRATMRQEIRLKLQAELHALTATDRGDELPARIKLLEAACIEAESAGVFDEEGKFLLEFSARTLERAEAVCKAIQKLTLDSEAFKSESFSLLWTNKRPPSGVLEVLECLVALVNMDAHTPMTRANIVEQQHLTGPEREESIASRWKHMKTVLKTKDEFNELLNQLLKFNPFSLGEELADCIGMIVAEIKPQEIVRKSAVCGEVLVYLASVLSVSSMHCKDLVARKKEKEEMGKEKEKDMTTKVVDWSDTDEAGSHDNHGIIVVPSIRQDGDESKKASESKPSDEDVRRVATWDMKTSEETVPLEAPSLENDNGGEEKAASGRGAEEANEVDSSVDNATADNAVVDPTLSKTADIDASVVVPGSTNVVSEMHSVSVDDIDSSMASQPDTSLLDGALSDSMLSNSASSDRPLRHTSVAL